MDSIAGPTRLWIFSLLVGLTLSANCSTGWKEYNGYCYLFHSITPVLAGKSWENARRSCQLYGADLADIQDKKENVFIFNAQSAAEKNQHFWLGISDKDVEGTFKYVDGTKATYFNWNKGEPNNYGGNEDCVETHYDGTFNDNSCYRMFGYICKKKIGAPSPTLRTNPPIPITKAETTCDAGWTGFSGKCYFVVFNILATFKEARQDCQSRGGDLTMPKTSDQQRFLRTAVTTYRRHDQYWIGLSDSFLEGKFYWVDKEPLNESLANWARNEPSNSFGGEDCVQVYAMTDPGKWNDNLCAAKLPYVCEKPAGSSLCPEGWVAYNDACYQINAHPGQMMSWKSARQACMSFEGADLVSIASPEEEQVVVRALTARGIWRGYVWIGISDNTTTGSFEWTDKSPLNYTHWDFRQPVKGSAGFTCGKISLYTKGVNAWSTGNCDVAYYYVCKRHREHGRCHDPLGMEDFNIGNDKITASSQKSVATPPYAARWNHKADLGLEGAWCADPKDSRPYLQVDIGKLYKISFVGLQGKAGSQAFVSKFYLAYGNDGVRWAQYGYNPPNLYKELTGNSYFNMRVGAVQTLRPTITSRFVRFYPLQNRTAVCMRVELYGCPANVQTSCGNDWVRGYRDDVCYKFSKYSLTWAAARADCISGGGELLSISNNKEKLFVTKALQNYKDVTERYWIGLNDRDYSRRYRWSDKTPLRVINWYRSNPRDRANRMNCVAVMSNNGYWFDDSCYVHRHYICKRQGRVTEIVKTPFNSMWISGTSHYWPLNEIINGKILGTRTGIVNGTIKVQNAFMDRKSFSFDGKGFLKIPDFRQTCVSLPKNCFYGLSVSFVMKHTSYPTTNKYILDIVGQHSKSAVGWSVYVKSARLIVTVENKFELRTSTVPFIIGGWRHVMFTWFSADNICIYIDGSLVRSRDSYIRRVTPNEEEEVTSLFVGASATSKSSGLAMDLTGLSIWERKLSAAEVAQVYRSEMKKCEEGWITYGQYCYAFETTRRNWAESQVHCQSLGGELASIHSGVEQALVTVGVGQSGILQNAWIGVNSKKLDHIYNWTDGSGLIFTNWASGEPNNMFGYRREDCGEVWQTGFWNDEYCYIRKPHICKKEKSVPYLKAVNKGGFQRQVVIPEYSVLPITCPLGTSILVNSAVYGKASKSCKKDVKDSVVRDCGKLRKYYCLVKSTNDIFGDPCPTIVKELIISYNCTPDNNFLESNTAECPQGWVRRPGRGSCYKLFMQEETWHDAKTFCNNAASGADLVAIADWSEQVFLTTLLVDAYVNPEVWNGLNDLANRGEYSWSDKTEVRYTNWFNGQPDDSSRQKSCVKMALQKGGGDLMYWMDDDCSHKHPFMCEVPKNTATRPPPVTTNKPKGNCYPGSTRVKNSCFIVPNATATWLDARDQCAKIGGKLASILDKEENDGVFKILFSGPQNVSIQEAWIGLTDKGIYRGQYWVDGSPVSFTVWDAMEPNSYLDMKACAVIGSNGYWRDTECSFKRPFICKGLLPTGPTSSPTASGKPTPTQDTTICPSQWHLWNGNGNCYFYKNKTEVDWYTARSSCVKAGGNLVSVNSKEEQVFVASLLSNFPDGRAWIGLSDLDDEGGFRWSDGSHAVFFNFEPNQPDDWHGMEDCVEIRNQGFWNDASCNRKFPYICKRHNNSVPVVTTLPPTAGPVSGYCMPGWLHYRNKCYKMYYSDGDLRVFKAAMNFCRGIEYEGRKGDLVSIHFNYENAFLNSRARDVGQTMWIGLNDIQIERTFGWSDQSPVTYTNWNYRQPDNYLRREDCVELASFYRIHGKWNDLDCDSPKGFICQVGASQVKPTGVVTKRPPKCPKGYVEYGDNCYSYKSTPLSWDNAREACRKDNAKSELVSIHHVFEQDHVFSYFAEFSSSVWIGLHRLQNTTRYQWSDSTKPDYYFWQGGVGALPNDVKGCVYAESASYSAGRWKKSVCDKKLPFVCKLTRTDLEYKPEYPGTCPDGWTKSNKHCYLFRSAYSFRQQWVGARQACRNIGGDLASVHSREEQNFLHLLVKDTFRTVWLGLNDRAKENRFTWSDGSPYDFEFWGSKEPNDKGGVENCVEMDALTGRWNDLTCSKPGAYICKRSLECAQPLGIENSTIIPDNSMSASSYYNDYFPQNGRLNAKENYKGWCTNITNTEQYLEVDLGTTTRVTSIASEGVFIRYTSYYILSYRLYFSDDRISWRPYQIMGKTALVARKRRTVQMVRTSLENAPAGRYIRINPYTWEGTIICLRFEVYGCKYECEAPLGIESKTLKDSALTASSADPSFKASYARLNLPGGRAWCSYKTATDQQWLQVDLAGIVQIGKIATQGLVEKDGSMSVVTAYKIAYSDDSKKWMDYKAINGETRIFSGNSHGDSIAFHRFSRAVSGRFIRFYPLHWKGSMCLRVEVFGCSLACNRPLGMESGEIMNRQISASSTLNSDHPPSKGRLNVGGNGIGAWCAAKNDRNQFLEVDLQGDVRVTAIAVQGFDNDIAKYVTDYSIQYSMDGKFWSTYAVNGKIMVLEGSKNGYSANKVALSVPVHGRYIRLNPQHWKLGICMRVELYGCLLENLPTDEPPLPKRILQVEMRLTSIQWQSELEDRKSKTFKDLANKVKSSVEQLYLDDYAFKKGFESVEVTGFRSGSVIVDFVVIFGTEDTRMTDPIKKSIQSGKLGDFEVDKDYLKIKDAGSAEKQKGQEEPPSGLSRGGKIALILFFIILIIVILLGGAFWYWKKRRETNQFAPKSFDNPVHYDTNTYNIDAGITE